MHATTPSHIINNLTPPSLVLTPKPPLHEAETPNTSIHAQIWGFEYLKIEIIVYYIIFNLSNPLNLQLRVWVGYGWLVPDPCPYPYNPYPATRDGP